MKLKEFEEMQEKYIKFYKDKELPITCMGKNNLQQLRQALKDYKI